jgi:hypothetical protein
MAILLFLSMEADMAHPVESALTRLAVLQWKLTEFDRKLVLSLAQEFFVPPCVEEVFQAGFFAIRAIPMFEKHAHNRRGHGNAFVRGKQNPAVTREVFMPGDPAKCHSEIDPWCDLSTTPIDPFVSNPHGYEPDVIRVLQRADSPAPIECDIKLPRQTVHIPMVQNEVMHPPGERPRVDQFVRVDARSGTRRDIADIVSTRPTVNDSEVGKASQEFDGVFGPDFTNLEVGSCGDVGVSISKPLA